MSVKHLKTSEFEAAVSEKDKLIVMDFWASWCGPCKMLSPVMDEISEELGDVAFYKVNVDEEESLAARFGIFSIPTVIMFKNGEAVGNFVGYADHATVKAHIEKAKS